jgi:hypothetical protein
MRSCGAEPREPGPVHSYLAAVGDRGGGIDGTPYAGFPAGLLRHIGMEEKILLPAAQRANGGVALPVAARLRLEHGAIALLVPTPSPTIVAALPSVPTCVRQRPLLNLV